MAATKAPATAPTADSTPPVAPAAAATPASKTASAEPTPVLVTAASTLPPATNTGTNTSAATPTSPGAGIFLQLGAFTTAANAESFRKFVGAELTSLADQLQVLLLDGRFRLHAGPFPSESDARSMASQIARELRFKPFLITR
ncbi:SPOR domain-containing protein [Niveibacterium sp. 24ML]|nr:SPOR domain-containing protein [Niveibacterium sp. 24ML]